jgi:hypothetical protein
MSTRRIGRTGKRKSKRVTPRKRPARRSSAIPVNASFDFIDAAAGVLDLSIDPAWKPAVAANLEATLRLAASVVDFQLPDDAEPAPIFVA